MTIRRTLTRLGAALLAGAVLPAAAAGAADYRQGDCGEFTVAMIPDTQNYVDYRHQKWSGFPIDGVDQFYQQMRWVGENAKSTGGEIAFATHVGDVWQHYSEWMDPGHAARGFQWMPNGGSEVARSPKVHTRSFEIPAAVQAFELVAGKLPFSVVPGNHDYDALWTDPAHPPQPEAKKQGVRHVGGLSGFQSAFSGTSEFFAGQPWYVGSHDGGADSAQVFTAGQCRFFHIGLQYHAPDASLAWASEVIGRYPNLPTIVTTHDYLGRDGKRNMRSNPLNSTLDPLDNDPEMIWDEFVSRHDQIFLVLSGHVGGQGFSVATNEAANPVYQMMADYQGRGQTAKSEGVESGPVGDGWLRLLTFHLDTDRPRIEVRTYSTHYGKFASELPEYGAWYKAHDGQGHLSDADYLAREEFTIALDDFHDRFGAPTDEAAQ
ncbi:serine/threonine protein phosphatase [Altererythrobacter sp. C41]|uniref:serine/threonine protein phosphatase n=1 Tax=Altererythrobacter sp. C41 TaxID=2806021 RepID=UPI001932302C|nr:serine/threonine protein phosphatase [Altererythrobacter sp. C41]MBM0170366.1 serine/threonine protein phosphatase [Altererythrobacter sp. C41]